MGSEQELFKIVRRHYQNSYGGFDDDAAAASSPELTAHGRSEHRLELEGGPDPGPQCPDDLTSFARATWGSPSHHSLGPSKGNLSEIKIGMTRADVMIDTGDGAAYAVVETLGRIGVGRATRILAISMGDVSCGAKASPIDENDFHSSLIRWADGPTKSPSTRRASLSDKSSTTLARTSPAG